jgi:hypothetical protein
VGLVSRPSFAGLAAVASGCGRSLANRVTRFHRHARTRLGLGDTDALAQPQAFHPNDFRGGILRHHPFAAAGGG